MSIQNRQELEALREAGRVVREALRAMEAHVKPGVTTDDLNGIGREVFERNGARSAPMVVYGFPADVCISVNEEVVHGVPSQRRIEAGDLVKLDVTVEKDGYMADAAVTVVAAPAPDDRYEMAACARRAFYRGMQMARAGSRVNEIGRAVENEVRRGGYAVVEGLCGHGIGRTIHEDPAVPNAYDSRARQRLTRGLVLTIEPMIAAGSGEVEEAPDGWTVRTCDGSLAAHWEHTLVIARGSPIVLTA